MWRCWIVGGERASPHRNRNQCGARGHGSENEPLEFESDLITTCVGNHAIVTSMNEEVCVCGGVHTNYDDGAFQLVSRDLSEINFSWLGY